MAESTDLLALATAASQASVALYTTVNSYDSHHQRVRDLAEETSALSAVLGSLTEMISASADTDLAALDIPLRGCGKACEEFELEIKKCSLRSGGGPPSIRNWARLKYMGEDIDGFRRVLSGYKLTITIALAGANLRKSALTAEDIKSYKELLNTTRAGLEDHLDKMDEGLNLTLRQRVPMSELDATEVRRMKEERLSTKRCLQICDQFSEHISHVKITARRSASAGASSDSDSMPENTTEGLKECKGMLQECARQEKRLFDTLMSKLDTASPSPETVRDIARLREELESTRRTMDFLSKACNHLEKNISIIKNHAIGDAMQIMVSTNGKTLHGTNRGLGWRTRQVGGHIDDKTVLQISREMATFPIRNPDDKGTPSRGETPTTLDNKEVTERHSRFMERYGEGFKLKAKSQSDI